MLKLAKCFLYWNQQFFLSWLLYEFHVLFTAASMWHDSVLHYRLTDAHLEFLKDRGLKFSKINKSKVVWVHFYWLRTIENSWKLNSSIVKLINNHCIMRGLKAELNLVLKFFPWWFCFLVNNPLISSQFPLPYLGGGRGGAEGFLFLKFAQRGGIMK